MIDAIIKSITIPISANEGTYAKMHPEPAPGQYPDTSGELWSVGTSAMRFVLLSEPGKPVLAQLTISAGTAAAPVQPLVEIMAVGYGHRSANLRNTATELGERLRLSGIDIAERADGTVVSITQRDPESSIETVTQLRLTSGIDAIQAVTTIRNVGDQPVVLQAVSSLMLADPTGTPDLTDVASIEADNEWLGEWRWSTRTLRATGADAASSNSQPTSTKIQPALPRLGLASHQHQDARGAHALVSHGSWSSGEHAPTGVITGPAGSLAWQIENPSPWRMELDVRLDATDQDRLVLGLLGSTDTDHGWLKRLAPGEEFTSVPVSIAWSAGGWESAIGEMTRHRRAIRRPQRARRAVFFNDYMNTLMGDPTTEKLLPLIAAAAEIGADYFCIDAGWYADNGDWWDSVGQWLPSAKRFPNGIDEPLKAIREAGMIPGLWLEPEVVGVRSPLAQTMPDDAFMQRNGVRIAEHGRYLLDLRHPAARAHLDEVVDRLVTDYGVEFFKLDYNVTPGLGTDYAADSPGDGLLAASEGYLTWLDGVLNRHPHLVIENCSSGAMRADYGILSRLELQSTSDQQELLRYPAIASGALMAILPEQAGNWAYPQRSMTAEEIAFTMITGLAGRPYVSGFLNRMTPEQRALIADAVALAKTFDDESAGTTPTWPLGLPNWDDDWVVVGRKSATETVLAVWFRGGEQRELTIPVPGNPSNQSQVEILYPKLSRPGILPIGCELTGQQLRITAPNSGPMARLIRIAHSDDPIVENSTDQSIRDDSRR